MIKGVFIGLGVVIVLAIIPVLHFVGVPAGPFIAGYFGINAASDYPGTPVRKSLVFGLWLGGIVGVIMVAAATIVTVVGEFAYPFLLWGGVVIATFYYSSMSFLGAWYSELRAIERAAAADRAAPAAGAPRR